jgi:MFS family permease
MAPLPPMPWPGDAICMPSGAPNWWPWQAAPSLSLSYRSTYGSWGCRPRPRPESGPGLSLPLFVQTIAPASVRVASITGLIIGVGAAAGAVGAVVLGRLGDRVGHRTILVVCAITSAVCYVCQSLARDPRWLLPFAAGAGKIILSPSKDGFCGPGTRKTRSKSPFDKLRVISR